MKTLVIHKKSASDFDVEDCFDSEQAPLSEEEVPVIEQKDKLDILLNGLGEESDQSDPFDIVDSDEEDLFMKDDEEVAKGVSCGIVYPDSGLRVTWDLTIFGFIIY